MSLRLGPGLGEKRQRLTVRPSEPAGSRRPSASRCLKKDSEPLTAEQSAREVSEAKRTARGTGLTRRRSRWRHPYPPATRWRRTFGAERLFGHRQRIERAHSLPSAMDEHRIGGPRPAPASQNQRSHSSNAVRERRHVGGRLGSGIPSRSHRHDRAPGPVRCARRPHLPLCQTGTGGWLQRFSNREATKGSTSWQ